MHLINELLMDNHHGAKSGVVLSRASTCALQLILSTQYYDDRLFKKRCTFILTTHVVLDYANIWVQSTSS